VKDGPWGFAKEAKKKDKWTASRGGKISTPCPLFGPVTFAEKAPKASIKAAGGTSKKQVKREPVGTKMTNKKPDVEDSVSVRRASP